MLLFDVIIVAYEVSVALAMHIDVITKFICQEITEITLVKVV